MFGWCSHWRLKCREAVPEAGAQGQGVFRAPASPSLWPGPQGLVGKVKQISVQCFEAGGRKGTFRHSTVAFAVEPSTQA